MSGIGPWTDEIALRARRLYVEEGRSARETAEILGPPFTRSAVIGKARRLGWLIDGARAEPRCMSLEERALRHRAAARKRRTQESAAAPRPQCDLGPKLELAPGWPPRMDAQLAADARPVRFIEHRRRQCVWPIGDYRETGSADMLVCGAPVAADRSYCAVHLCLSRRLKPAKPPVAGSSTAGDDVERAA
jgi:hypothetical protein